MATKMSEKLSVREGLIQVVSAERFQSKPRSGGNTHVVVMEKTGRTVRHYCTLRSDKDTLSIGEQLWGNFVCYVVDLSSRELRIEEEFPTHDRITDVRAIVDVIYRATDGELVALGIEDALQSLREDLVTLLRREIVRLPLEQVTEEYLETRLNQESTRFQTRLGIAIERTRVRVDWPEEVLARRRAAEEREHALREEDVQRRRDWELEDRARQRKERLELEDIEHIDTLIRRLGLEALPADVRLRLHALPREEAMQQVIALIEEQRRQVQDVLGRRMEQEYDLVRKLIDDGVLEEMDLVDFGKALLDRYRNGLTFGEAFGMPSRLLFGESRQPRLGSQKTGKDEPPGQLPDSVGRSAGEGAEPGPDSDENSQGEQD
jgi:hypothetical protein